MRFPAKKNARCLKAPRDFPPRKDGILYPHRVVLGLPSPSHRVCADGRTYGSTDGHVTITKQSKFLGVIGYQISLAMELRYYYYYYYYYYYQSSTQAFSSRSHDLAQNFVTSPNGIPRKRLVNNAKSKMAPSD